MPSYRIQLIKQETLAEHTAAFFFEKPEEFSYAAGQYVSLKLLNPPHTDEKGDSRLFSLSSAPHEEHLIIATRLRSSAFKRSLEKMQQGDEAALSGPFGSFALHEDVSVPAVFLAGGIGIATFRSFLTHAAHRNLTHSFFLFYSNHRPEDTVWLEELQALKEKLPSFTLIPTMTSMEQSAHTWEGERGVIDEAMLARYLSDINEPLYYIVGPPGMVAGMQVMLSGAGVPMEQVKIEEFSGY